MTYTEADFDNLSWHDCRIWGVELRTGDPDNEDWTSDTAFDIDFIVEWVCGVGSPMRFLVAPATLVFHGVTDPKINIDWGNSGHQVALYQVMIASVERELIQDQKVHLDQPYYAWKIELNCPDSSDISFGALGFTQTLRSKPVLADEQHLSLKVRNLIAGQ